MNEIRIYQIEMTRGCEYSFMGYKYAEGKLDMNDYKLVAEFDDEDTSDDMEILEKMWIAGNNGTLQQAFKMRSISVSDIIEINGKKYYVDSFGFKEV